MMEMRKYFDNGAMTEKRTTKVPVEDVLLFTAQQLTETAYDRFTEGVVSQVQLREFYEVVRDWSRASEQMLETMNKHNRAELARKNTGTLS
jgi:hypothetical protein